jgi:hypothetical protein
MFIFLLALGEDYNILVMSRIREEVQHLPLHQAVSRALGATGTTVTSAGLVLAGTFSVFAIVGGRQPGGSQIEDVGVGLALGVLMDTFIVRTVLVPATVMLLGRWNWWPSKLSRVAALPEGGEGGGEGTERDTEPVAPQSRLLLRLRWLAAPWLVVPVASGSGGQWFRWLVGQGVDGDGQVAQGGGGVAQGGLALLRQRHQRRPDDLFVHPVPSCDRGRAFLGQVQADRSPVAGAARSAHVTGRLEPVEQGRHRAGREPEHPGQLAWPHARVLGHAGEQFELGDGEAERGVGRARGPAHRTAQPGHDIGQFGADLFLREVS